jgi:hypothetical protein
MLDPLALAYDAGRQRLVVIDQHGSLQVLNAEREGQPRNYITQWGGFGPGDGHFLVTPSTVAAVVVDGEGRVHVADAGAPGGRVQIFDP